MSLGDVLEFVSWGDTPYVYKDNSQQQAAAQLRRLSRRRMFGMGEPFGMAPKIQNIVFEGEKKIYERENHIRVANLCGGLVFYVYGSEGTDIFDPHHTKKSGPHTAFERQKTFLQHENNPKKNHKEQEKRPFQ